MIISIRLRPGKDDELEKTLKKIPEGDRSRVVRNILKSILRKEPNNG
ncbi:hypothetical protein [Natronospora cellulosivora (SeqCode)]